MCNLSAPRGGLDRRGAPPAVGPQGTPKLAHPPPSTEAAHLLPPDKNTFVATRVQTTSGGSGNARQEQRGEACRCTRGKRHDLLFQR